MTESGRSHRNTASAGPDQTARHLYLLLQRSIIAWGLIARVEADDGAVIRITGLGRVITISRAPAGLPFRWRVACDGRTRFAASVVGVLRLVRRTLDPGHRGGRARAVRTSRD
jgi:hypothetical protein